VPHLSARECPGLLSLDRQYSELRLTSPVYGGSAMPPDLVVLALDGRLGGP